VKRPLLLLLVVVAAACGSDEPEEPVELAKEGWSVSGAGLELRVPAAWDARLYLANDVTPVVQAATFQLPPVGPDVPADPPAEAFGDDGLYVTLVGLGDVRHGGVPMPSPVRWDEVTLPLGIAMSHVERGDGLSVATRHVIVDGRAFRLRVVLASNDPSDDVLAPANDVLSTLAVKEWRPGKCPPTWPGPWTACPEAAWVRLIAGSAGYPITDETGSALVAEGRGHGFYIWATKAADEPPAAQGWKRLGTVEGVDVFDDGIRRRWVAQGFVFWLQAGPSTDATLPLLGEMQPLVQWSLDLPPPD
jgi:hypothetical protein